MNTKTEYLKSSLVGGLPLLTLAAALIVGVLFIDANAPDRAAVDGNEPDNTPTFETYRAEAEKVCGGPVIAPGPKVIAADVVVVKNDGSTVRMDTTEAYERNTNRNEADNIWPIAVCAA